MGALGKNTEILKWEPIQMKFFCTRVSAWRKQTVLWEPACGSCKPHVFDKIVEGSPKFRHGIGDMRHCYPHLDSQEEPIWQAALQLWVPLQPIFIIINYVYVCLSHKIRIFYAAGTQTCSLLHSLMQEIQPNMYEQKLNKCLLNWIELNY